MDQTTTTKRLTIEEWKAAKDATYQLARRNEDRNRVTPARRAKRRTVRASRRANRKTA